jgi:pyridoxamine 5'-phosphate oxidase
MIAAMARHGHDPIAKFIRWLEDARRARIPNYEAMALATAARSGKSSVRFVLLKGIDQRGFMFFTDARSRKGRELRGNPHGSLALYSGPGFVCVLMRSNSGPTANIAYTTVRSIFGTVADGDVICSSPRRPPTQVPARFFSGQIHTFLVSRQAAGPSPVPPTFADLYRFPRRRKESRVDRPLPRSTSGTESSNLSRSATQSGMLPYIMEKR